MPAPIVAGTMHAKDVTRGSSSKQRKKSVPGQHLPRKGKKQQPERREMEGREREREIESRAGGTQRRNHGSVPLLNGGGF